MGSDEHWQQIKAAVYNFEIEVRVKINNRMKWKKKKSI